MASDYDPAEFVDSDFQAHRSHRPAPAASSSAGSQHAPTREDVDSKVMEAQQKLAELKRAQEDLERERTALEEVRRRQMEFQTGRQEMVHNLTRGLGLLEEAEFTARRDAEQMAKTLIEFRDALSKLEAIHDEAWTGENFNVELTRALTTIENARMEWNTARLKLPILSGETRPDVNAGSAETAGAGQSALTELSFGELCKLGLAITWPLTLTALAALGIFLFLLLRH